MNILVTGAAGFIGYHLARRLLREGHRVVGIDNLNSYYAISLKYARLQQLTRHPNFQFTKLDIGDRLAMSSLFEAHVFDCVVNLAAQAGVRYSIEHPETYIDSNLVGFANVLEGCRRSQVSHLVYASSSSVYGTNLKVPFATTDPVDRPVSFYAATKKANELMAHSYSHLYAIPTTGLRFFTVYGPWGRPDMAYFKFVRAISTGQPIDVYNYGKMRRDFTYIDDIIEGVVRVMNRPPTGDRSDTGSPPYKLYNIGNNNPVELADMIHIIECALGRSAIQTLLPMQPGDVLATYADVDELIADVGFKPETSLEEGIAAFVHWYCQYYEISTPFSSSIKHPNPFEVTALHH